jgi:hypothetical protein
MAQKAFVVPNFGRSDGEEVCDSNIEIWLSDHPHAVVDYIEDDSSVDWTKKIVHFHSERSEDEKDTEDDEDDDGDEEE